MKKTNKLFTKLSTVVVSLAMALGVGVAAASNGGFRGGLFKTAFAAEDDKHDFDQTLQQLLNNNASISPINIAEQSYPVKSVIVSYRYNNTKPDAVTINVTVGGTNFGSFNVNGTGGNYQTQAFNGAAIKGAVAISFVNNTGSGTGHGTFYVNKVQLVEGGVATGKVASVDISNAPSATIEDVAIGTAGPTLTASANLASGSGNPSFIWSSDNPSAVVVNSTTGALTYAGNGTANITATASFPKGDGVGDTNVGSVAITTSHLHGSETYPYTVAEARALIDDGEKGDEFKTNVCTTGIVSDAGSFNQSYGSITYFISADGQTTSDQLKIYGGKDAGGKKFTGASDVQVGDVVVIKGNLDKYNDDYEYLANNERISCEKAGVCNLSGDFDGKATLSVTGEIEENAALDLTITAAEHYTLPASLTVTIGSDPYAGFTYSRNEGNRTASFHIDANVINDNVVISGECVADPKYTVTFAVGENGTGTGKVVANQWAGDYTLPLFSSFEKEEIAAADGYRFKCYEVGGVEKNPGATITLSSDVTITAIFEVKTTLGNIVSGEKYFIIATYNDQEYYLKSFTSTESVGDSAVLWPGDENMPATDTDAWTFTETATDDCWTITNNNGDVLYSIKDNNGLRCSTSDNTWQVADEDGLRLYNTAHSTPTVQADEKGKYLTLYNGTNWRTYTTKDAQGVSSSNVRFVKYVAPATLDSLTIEGQKTAFKVGDNFSIGEATITAHYSSGNVVIPANDSGLSFKINGTAITTSDALTMTNNGQNVVVTYTDSKDRSASATAYAVNVSYETIATYSIDVTDNVKLAHNGEITVNATITPANADQTVTWESSDTNIATVSAATGKTITVKASSTGVGDATITATFANGEEITFVVTVSADPVVTLDPHSISVYSGAADDTITATASNFEEGDTLSYVWEVVPSDSEVVTVSGTGATATLKYGKAGTAKVRVTVSDQHENSEHVDCEVTVNQSEAKSIDIVSEIDDGKLYLGTAEGLLTLTATVDKVGHATTGVTWESSDSSIASVTDEGVVGAEGAGTATITATSEYTPSVKATYDVTVIAPDSLRVEANPNKTIYPVGGTIDPTGIKVKAVFGTGDNVVEKDAVGFTIGIGLVDMSTAGEKTVGVYLEGKETSFKINVAEYYEKLTDLSQLKSGDEIIIVESTNGKALGSLESKNYFNETNVAIDESLGIAKLSGLNAMSFKALKSGDKWALKNADGKFLTAKAAKSATLSESLETLSISLDDDKNAIISFGDAVGRILYNKNSNRFASYTSDTNAGMLLPQIYVIHAAHEEEDIKLSSIAITDEPTKKTYEIGEELNLAGITVTATYSDGSTKEITSGYTTSGFDSTTAGEKTVTVTYEGKTAEFKVTVNDAQPSEKTLLGIDVTANPTKTTYEINETFNPAGLEVTAKYSDQSSEKVTNYSLSQVDMSTTGLKEITVTYEGKTATFTITVNDSSQPGEDVEAAKASAIELLRQHMLDLLNSGEYDTDGAAKLGQEYGKGIAAINSATTVAEVNAAYAAARAALDAVEKQSGGETDPLAQAKADAIADMEAYVAAKGQDNYSETNWAGIQTILNAAKDSINSCTTANDIRDTVTGAKLFVDAVKTSAQEAEEAAAAALAKAKTDAIAELEAYVAAKGQDNYSETNWTTIQTVLNAAKESINNCTSIEDVQTTVSGAKAFIDLAKTIDQEAKEAAIAELEALVNGLNRADYSDEAWAELQDTLADARAAINRATDATALNNLVTAWKAAIGDVTADIKTAKDAAIRALDAYYASFDKNNYDEAGLAALLEAYNTGKANINAAESTDAVAAALVNAKAALDAVNTKPSAPAKRCGGDIAATSIILSALALAGVGLLVFKKRKQD